MRGNSTSEKAMKSSFEMEAGRKNFTVTVTALELVASFSLHKTL
jgi:hypothetical protein